MDAANDIPGLLGCFGKVKQREIFRSDHALFDQQGPVDEAFPKCLAHENNRDVVSFTGLKKGQRSNSSSSVPNPPGKTTRALARSRKCILRQRKIAKLENRDQG